MKIIENRDLRYYVQSESESIDIRNAIRGKGFTMSEAAERLNMSYESLWRKLYNRNDAYFMHSEIEKLIELTGIKLVFE